MDYPKYIVIESEWGVECPIIFSHMLNHADVAGPRTVLAAGSCSIDERNGEIIVSVWGKSTSLGGIGSRGEEDVKLIRKQILWLDS